MEKNESRQLQLDAFRISLVLQKRVALSVKVKPIAIITMMPITATQSPELNGMRKFVHGTSVLLGMRITMWVL
jgi:hypothetical protein